MASELRLILGRKSGMIYKMQALARLLAKIVVASSADNLAACSSFCAEQLSLKRSVQVLYNPIPVMPGQPARALSALPEIPRFVFAGRITGDKGWDILFDAAEYVHKLGRTFLVQFVGDGPDMASLQARINESTAQGWVQALGRRDSEALQRVFGLALAVIVPSRFQEPAGYIPAEAAALQVMSIVARSGGLQEVAGPASLTFQSGDWLELANHMIALLDSPAEAVRLGRECYLRAHNIFDPRDAAAKVVQLLSR
jgi:glycosyltransferase involved in cell wall biosynthesis